MAGTWLLEGPRAHLSVQRGVTVAKSQTHALHTIRVLLMKSALKSQVGAARQRSGMCSFLCPSRGLIHFTASLFLHLDFPLGTSAIPEVVTGLLFSLPSSPRTPNPRCPSFPIIPEYTSHVPDTRGRLAQPVLNPILLQRGKVKGLCCYFTCNTTPTCSPLSVEPLWHKSYIVFLWHTAVGALHLW